MELTTLTAATLMALMNFATPNPNAKIDTYELPAVAGLWQIELDQPASDGCYERYNFGKDGRLTTTSGAERTTGNYRLQHLEEFNLPVLAMSTKFDNDEVDCSGNQVNQAGEATAVFVKFDSRYDPKQMQWCADPEGQDCSSVLNKILP